MSRTTIRMRVLPRFPARISGTNGIQSVRDGADLVLKNDFSSMIRVPAIDDPAKIFLLVWNVDLNSYSIMSFTDTFAAAIDVTGLATAADLATKLSLSGGVMTGAIQDAVFAPSSAPTKKAHFDLTRITPGQDRDIIVPDVGGLALSKWEIIKEYTITAGTGPISIPNLSAFRKLRLSGKLTPSAQANIALRTSIDNGATYSSGPADYNWTAILGSASSVNVGNSGSGSSFLLCTPGAVDANTAGTFKTVIEGFNKAENMSAMSQALGQSSSLILGFAGGNRLSTVARNALQIFMTAGTMSGTLTVEGIRG